MGGTAGVWDTGPVVMSHSVPIVQYNTVKSSLKARGEKGLRFGELRIASLFYAVNVILLAVLDNDLQQVLSVKLSVKQLECEGV